MSRKILCVAEKPAIARAVASHMSGGSFQTVSVPQNRDGNVSKITSTQFEGINMSKITSLTSILAVPGVTARSL